MMPASALSPPSRDTNHRFDDRGRYAWEFAHEYAVVCPRCRRRATVFPDALSWRAKSARVTCTYRLAYF